MAQSGKPARGTSSSAKWSRHSATAYSQKSVARVHLDKQSVVTGETDMTQIGTGFYTVIAQTAAERMGVPIEKVLVRLGDSSFPASAGSGGQLCGNSSTAGVYAGLHQTARVPRHQVVHPGCRCSFQ
ncbi:molybdopterin cofactor-binding domain-containing protein [Luteolibacter yonseiensis]|uniref:molybdopterin cofactor-binding domain-containing protein n=1 Tax=Luteolibacter yonseiensis TaxID=1144680 RepID=UPI0031F2E7C7